jgi:hypothetical protein
MPVPILGEAVSRGAAKVIKAYTAPTPAPIRRIGDTTLAFDKPKYMKYLLQGGRPIDWEDRSDRELDTRHGLRERGRPER